MASDDTRRSVPARRLPAAVRVLIGLTALLAVLAGLAVWVFGTTSGARALFSVAGSMRAGMLETQGVEGRIAGPLRVQRLVFSGEGRRVVLSDVRLDWRPSALLRGLLHIRSLDVGYLRVDTRAAADEKPASLPQQLALPLGLQVDGMRMGGGEVHRDGKLAFRLGAFASRLAFDGDRYRFDLERASFRAPAPDGFSADVNGQAILSASRPFNLTGRFSARTQAAVRDRPVGASGTAVLGGSLEQIDLMLDGTAAEAVVAGSAILRPFSDRPLGQTRVQVQGLDLSRFGTALPQTAIDARMVADEHGAGTLALTNAQPGTHDAGRLPLQTLQAAFRQDTSGLHADDIAARLGTAGMDAGEVRGNATLAGDRLTLQLRTDALDLKRLDRRLHATALAGRAELQQAAGTRTLRIALSEPLDRRQRATLEVQATMSDTEILVQQALLQAGSGRMAFTGRMGLEGAQPFSAEGNIVSFRLADFGRFPQLPELELNGRFSLAGMRLPQPEADLSFRISDSRLAGHPLAGDGEARLRGERLEVPRLQLSSGANRLQADGELSGADAELRFSLDAPRLAQLGPGFAGALTTSGSARGTLSRARVAAEWRASGVRTPWQVEAAATHGKADVSFDRAQAQPVESASAEFTATGLAARDDRIADLKGRVRFSPRPEAPLELDLRLEGLAGAALRAERVVVNARGTTGRHVLELALDEAGQAWSARAEGGLALPADAPRWTGSIDRFTAAGRFDARLAGPSALQVSPQRVQLEDFVLDADSGRIAVELFARDADGMQTRGRLERIQLASLLRFVPRPPPVRTDLVLSGEWNARVADSLTATLSVRREGGDVTVLANAPVALGLRALSIDAEAGSGRAAIRVEADGRQLGRIAMDAATTIGDGASRLAIAPGAPLSGNVRIDAPSLAWIAPLLSPSLFLDGRLRSDVALGGTVGEPRISGRIAGEALRVLMTDIGLDLRQGTLDSSFDGDRLVIRELAFRGEEGRILISGPVEFAGGSPSARLTLAAEGFALLNRSDRRIVISGGSTLVWNEGAGRVGGAFRIDSGVVDLGHADRPRLSGDVVIVGREKKRDKGTAFDVDITIDLADNVALRGRGLDATLGGEVRLASETGESLQAQGTIRVVKGSYTAYGRELAIEQGAIRFRGPLNNPSLDILAMRRGQEVEAGVSIRGTALTPRIALVSEPPVPDAEKLSWLVLGRGLSTAAGDTDLGALQSAAGALLSEGAKAGVQSRIASAFGLDTFSIGTSQDSLQQRIVTIGKQISSRLYLSYQQGLESAGSVLQVRYTLSPKLSLEAEAGSRSAISLFYNIAFD